MIKNRAYYLLPALMLAVLASGCTLGAKKKTAAVNDGGVFVTVDKGLTWAQRAQIPTVSGKPASFAAADLASWAMDPGDEKAIYYAPVGNGLYYTYDAGRTWSKAEGLGNVTVRAIAVDPANKCRIYGAVGNRVFRSEDCSRSWKQVYFDAQATVTIDALAMSNDGAKLYAGLSRGDLIVSRDSGETWQTLARFKSRFTALAVDPNDQNVMYALFGAKGLQKSRDAGANWEDYAKPLKDNKLSTDVKGVVLLKGRPEFIMLASANGIVRSEDGGAEWAQLELIPPEKNAVISAIAVNPQEPKEVYYVSGSTFFRSGDGGATWKTVKLPTTRTGLGLLINPKQPNIIYVAVRATAKK